MDICYCKHMVRDSSFIYHIISMPSFAAISHVMSINLFFPVSLKDMRHITFHKERDLYVPIVKGTTIALIYSSLKSFGIVPRLKYRTIVPLRVQHLPRSIHDGMSKVISVGMMDCLPRGILSMIRDMSAVVLL